MLQTHAKASTPPTATEARPLVTDEDVLRRWNSSWRDTAFGRAEHYRTCPASSHRRCGNVPAGVQQLGRAA